MERAALLFKIITAILPWLNEATKKEGFTFTYFIFAVLYLLIVSILMAADLYLDFVSSTPAEDIGKPDLHHP